MRGPDPVTSSALDAVSGCTRALAGSTALDAPFGTADAATVGALRAFGDRLAIRERFENPSTYLAARPADTPASAIYDALALARLDALGVLWLPGIAKNLLAHPGVEEDGVRWLGFEAFSGAPAPRERSAAADRTREALTPRLLAHRHV